MLPEKGILISRCRTHITLISILSFIFLICAVAYLDITGNGLSSTIYFRLIGSAIYPLFYGISIFVLINLIQIIINQKRNFYFESGHFYIPGRQPFRISEIDSIQITGARYTEKIVILLFGGKMITMHSYFLYEDLNIVKEKIESIRDDGLL